MYFSFCDADSEAYGDEIAFIQKHKNKMYTDVHDWGVKVSTDLVRHLMDIVEYKTHIKQDWDCVVEAMDNAIAIIEAEKRYFLEALGKKGKE